MKKLIAFSLMIACFGPSVVSAQQLEAENSHELSKTARKGEIYHFSYNEDAREYLLIYCRDKKKDSTYEIY